MKIEMTFWEIVFTVWALQFLIGGLCWLKIFKDEKELLMDEPEFSFYTEEFVMISFLIGSAIIGWLYIYHIISNARLGWRLRVKYGVAKYDFHIFCRKMKIRLNGKLNLLALISAKIEAEFEKENESLI